MRVALKLLLAAASLVFIGLLTTQDQSAQASSPGIDNPEVANFLRGCERRNLLDTGCNCDCSTPRSLPANRVVYLRCSIGRSEAFDCTSLGTVNAHVDLRDRGLAEFLLYNTATGEVISSQSSPGPLPTDQDGGVLVFVDGELDLGQSVVNIITLVFILLAFAAIAVALYGGWTYVTAEGDDEKIAAGGKTFLNAVIGVIIMIIAVALVNAIAGAFGFGVGLGFDNIFDANEGVQRDIDLFENATP